MSYKSFEFSLKTDYVFAEDAIVALKTQLKYFDAAINEGNRVEADKRYKEAVKAVDQAAARGLLHKNTAANRKSKMTLRLNKI